MQEMHDWYMQASKEGVDVVTCKIRLDISKDEGEGNMYGLYFDDLDTIFWLGKIDNIVITLCCM